MSSRLIKRLKTDVHYRIKVFLRCSVLFNFLYSVFLFVVNRINGSEWFFIMSVYYALLSVVRIFTFLQIEPRKQLRTKLKTMRWCGYFLFLLNVVVSALIFILIYFGVKKWCQNRGARCVWNFGNTQAFTVLVVEHFAHCA